MIRLVAYACHRLVARYWWGRARAAMRVSREAYRRNLLFAGRAEARDARADALVPPPSTGPPRPTVPAGAEASAQGNGP